MNMKKLIEMRNRHRASNGQFSYETIDMMLTELISLCDDTETDNPPELLKFDGNPVWAHVSNNENGAVVEKRQVIAGNKFGYLAICDGKSNLQSRETCHWRYAWCIPE